jgi:hypothetical protein
MRFLIAIVCCFCFAGLASVSQADCGGSGPARGAARVSIRASGKAVKAAGHVLGKVRPFKRLRGC